MTIRNQFEVAWHDLKVAARQFWLKDVATLLQWSPLYGYDAVEACYQLKLDSTGNRFYLVFVKAECDHVNPNLLGFDAEFIGDLLHITMITKKKRHIPFVMVSNVLEVTGQHGLLGASLNDLFRELFVTVRDREGNPRSLPTPYLDVKKGMLWFYKPRFTQYKHTLKII